MDRVIVALGSNLGDRRAHLDFAVSKLRTLVKNLTVSRYYNTVPMGVPGPTRVMSSFSSWLSISTPVLDDDGCFVVGLSVLGFRE